MGPGEHSGADRLQEQREVLGRAGRLLAAADDFGDTLKQSLAACLPALGDFGFFDVAVGNGEVRRTVAAYQGPHIESLLAPTQWVKQTHPELNLCAFSTGDAALHPAIDDAWYGRVAANEQHLGLLRELAFRSMITVPVRYRDELVGALTLFMGSSGRRHDADDLAFAGELAALAAPVVVTARLLEQQRNAEAQLRMQEERLRLAVEAGQVGIWDWDIARQSVTWSDRVYDMHKMARGSDTGGLEGFRSRIHPDDLATVEGALQAALAGGPAYRAEFRTVLANGEVRWIATRGHLVRDGAGQPTRMVGASTDITERMDLLAGERIARAEAEAAQRRVELLSSAGALLAKSLDPEDTLRTIATTVVPGIADWCRIDLLDDEGVLRRRLAYHQDPERAQEALEMARTMRAAPATVGSMAWCIANASDHHGRFDLPPATDDPVLRAFTSHFGMHAHYILPLVARGRTIGAMGVVQAESGRILGRADRALIRELGQRAALALDNARAYAEAEAARRQAESASRAKDEFLAMLGHELRNPLAPIATALELMARRDAKAHVEERRIIGRQVTHLSRLIDDLLDVSRITQGKVELKQVAVEVRTLIAHALEQTQPVYERRAQPVQVRLDAAGARVLGDPTRLTQVLCNLLINAAKFTPPDGRVEVTLRADATWVEIVVEDSGRGIAPELLPHVFDLFVQGRQSIDRRSGGLGLGLAIVRMLVERHGGQVQAASGGDNQGSRFTVRLPALLAQGVTEGEHPMEPATPTLPATPARILIVDDNADAADTLGELLKMVGYEVRVAGDAEAALALVQEDLPQLALLDIGLPGMDGYELAERLRADARTRGIKLVALTGYGRENDRSRALGAQFDEHVVKPVAVDKLFELLGRMLA
ncbi:ATP-binding protein [Caenimonas sedimenti]|uniref:ATP-binding protein n=1 Tax=Caenimonas sedimenti TaxID=2596921 RepID=UPI0016495494|nr:ATP-binding protein [Caenimonas sedimenti]